MKIKQNSKRFFLLAVCLLLCIQGVIISGCHKTDSDISDKTAELIAENAVLILMCRGAFAPRHKQEKHNESE